MEKQSKTFKVFVLIFVAWCIDFITTIILLNGDSQFYETNPIGFWFYQFGLIGFVGSFFFNMLFILGATLIANYLIEIKSNTEKSFKLFLWFMFTGAFIGMELYAIVNNLILMSGF